MAKKGYTPWNKGIKYRNKTSFVGICTYCQTKIELPPNREKRFKFCSKECQYRSMKNRIPWNKEKKGLHLSPLSEWKKGMTPWNKGEKFHCLDCGESVWRKSVRCKKCFSKWKFQIRMNHPRWKEDRSTLKIGDRVLHDQLSKWWAKDVKIRDSWKCRIADENCFGKLEAHHILPWSQFPELRYQLNNGITLCHAHHPRSRDDVAKLSPYFQSLVAEMN